MAKKISIGLIGAGRIGAMHADNLRAHADFSLAAVFDENRAAAKKAAANDAAVADQAEQIFSDPAIRAVLIASSTPTHCGYILRAAKAGKAVLCEKPVDLDIARANACARQLARLPKKPVVQIGFNRRFDPGHAAVLARVRAGEIGKLEKLIITSRDPGLPPAAYLRASGGIWRDMVIHDFDIARAMLPQEPARLFASGGAMVAPALCKKIGDSDTAAAILQTASGALCVINASRRAAYGYDQRIEAFGEKGMLISGNRTATQVEAHTKQRTAAREPLLNFFIERYADSYRRQLDSFARTARGLQPAWPSFEDGRRALILANTAAASQKSGRFEAVKF